MYIRRKVFSVIEPEEKLYGEVKRANKAKKRANLISSSQKVSRDIIEKSNDDLSRRIKSRNRLIDLENSLRDFDEKNPKNHIQLSPKELNDAAKVRAARSHQRGVKDSLNMVVSPNKSKVSFDELADNSKSYVRDAKLNKYKRDKLFKEAWGTPFDEKITPSTQESAEKVIQEKASNAIKDQAKKVEETVQEKASNAIKDQVKKKGFKLSRNQKIGAAVLGGTALIGAGTYAYKKHKKSKENKD